jgi:Lipase (class 3)
MAHQLAEETVTFSPADVSELLKYAKAADLAYATAQGMSRAAQEAAWLALGYELKDVIIDLPTDTHVSIASSADEIVVSPKGTSGLTNMMTDANTILTEWKGHRVHKGGLEAYNAIKDRVLARLYAGRQHPPVPVTYAAHSLGALINTLMIYDHHTTPVPWYSRHFSYGSPRVGTLAFAEAYNALSYNRITNRLVHTNDLVPQLPLAFYHHVTGGADIHDDGTFPGPVRMWWRRLVGFERELKADVELETIPEHYLSAYIAAITKALK